MTTKEEQILNTMITRNIIPNVGIFDVSSEMIDAFYNIHRELFPPKSSKQPSPSDLRYNRKLAGLSLMKLNLNRKVVKNISSKNAVEKPKCGIIYLISNPAFPGCYKIGLTQNLDRRLASYQTYDPYKRYKVECYKFVSDIRKEEKRILLKYKVDIINGEWVSNDTLKEIFTETL